jgi:hypothetical protein
MKKVLTILLTLALVMGLMSGVVMAEEEYPAAPDVASRILENHGVETRYPSGEVKKNGKCAYNNYISDVAHEMDNEAKFPAYDWDGEWDGSTYVEKCDVENYYKAVYYYLLSLGAPVLEDLSVIMVNQPIDAYACEIIKSEGTTYPTAQVIDKYDNPVEGVEVRASLIYYKDFTPGVVTDESGIAVFDFLSYDVPGEYQMRFWLADATLRNDNTKPLSEPFLISPCESVIESIVYSGISDAFGSALGETLTLTFSSDIDFLGTTSTTYGVELWFVGDPNRLGSSRSYMVYEINENVLTITCIKVFSDKRPDVGDVIDHFVGLVDLFGNPVVVPAGGVAVTD